MISGIWGRKIGMTQVYDNDCAIPVTVIDIGNWIVTGTKTEERDGYNAIQIGRLRKRFIGVAVEISWLKNLKTYFSFVREVRVDKLPENLKIGQPFDVHDQLKKGELIDVFGVTRGRGFAGVIRRHDFNGPPGSHGSTMGRRPGSVGHMKARGRVIKGKRMPGHMGVERCVMKNLDVIDVKQDGPIVLVKGSVPGHSGSLLFLSRHKTA